MLSMTPRNIRRRRRALSARKASVLLPSISVTPPPPQKPCEMQPEKLVARILEILALKQKAIAGMGHLTIAKGVEVAATEINVLCVTEFGIDPFALEYRS